MSRRDALVALLLASLGIFGVFSYLGEEQRREIGIRLALGATGHQVRRSLASATGWPIAGGITAGLALAMVAGRLLRASLYGISILNPLSYFAVAAILGSAAVVATFLPLRRALRVDPAVTLKQD